jgi:hypothetical protein
VTFFLKKNKNEKEEKNVGEKSTHTNAHPGTRMFFPGPGSSFKKDKNKKTSDVVWLPSVPENQDYQRKSPQKK